MRQAQAALDAWVASYNEQRPHSALDMQTPVQRFTPQVAGLRPADDSALHTARSGPDWLSRKVAANGIISVAWQEISCGKHRAGRLVDVHVDGKKLEIWDQDDLVRTVLRTSDKEVRKKRGDRRAS